MKPVPVENTGKKNQTRMPEKVTKTMTQVEQQGKKVSSNSYANGNNQNSGNFITDRPTT